MTKRKKSPAGGAFIWASDQSHGIITPGNAITAVAFVMVLLGTANITSLSGVALIFLGRSLDAVDGRVARRTNTVSAVGETFDAVADKVAIGLILLAGGITELIPVAVILAVVIQNVINTGFGMYAKFENHDIETTQIGKYTMAFQSVALVAFLAAPHASDNLEFMIKSLAWFLTIASIHTGSQATWRYALKALRLNKK